MEFRHRRGSAHGRSWAENDKDMAAAPVWATALNRVSASCGCRSGSTRGAVLILDLGRRRDRAMAAGASSRFAAKGEAPGTGAAGPQPGRPSLCEDRLPESSGGYPRSFGEDGPEWPVKHLQPRRGPTVGKVARAGLAVGYSRPRGGGRLRAGRASPPWRCSAVEAGLDRLDGAGAAPPVGAPSLPSWPARR